MHVLPAIGSLLFRVSYWIICFPLELVRAVLIIPVFALARACTNKKFARIFVVAIFFYFACRVAPMNQADYTIAIVLVAFAMVASVLPEPVLRTFPYPVKAPWRRSRRPNRAKAGKEITASIVIKSFSDVKESRALMTARLSPALQALLKPAPKV
jgi:hypothetical protein